MRQSIRDEKGKRPDSEVQFNLRKRPFNAGNDRLLYGVRFVGGKAGKIEGE